MRRVVQTCTFLNACMRLCKHVRGPIQIHRCACIYSFFYCGCVFDGVACGRCCVESELESQPFLLPPLRMCVCVDESRTSTAQECLTQCCVVHNSVYIDFGYVYTHTGKPVWSCRVSLFTQVRACCLSGMQEFEAGEGKRAREIYLSGANFFCTSQVPVSCMDAICIVWTGF